MKNLILVLLIAASVAWAKAELRGPGPKDFPPGCCLPDKLGQGE